MRPSPSRRASSSTPLEASAYALCTTVAACVRHGMRLRRIGRDRRSELRAGTNLQCRRPDPSRRLMSAYRGWARSVPPRRDVERQRARLRPPVRLQAGAISATGRRLCRHSPHAGMPAGRISGSRSADLHPRRSASAGRPEHRRPQSDDSSRPGAAAARRHRPMHKEVLGRLRARSGAGVGRGRAGHGSGVPQGVRELVWSRARGRPAALS